MIRKRKSQTEQTGTPEMDADLMEGNYPFSKKESISKEAELRANKPHVKPAEYVQESTGPTIVGTDQLQKRPSEYAKIIENLENPVGDILGLPRSRRVSRIGIANIETPDKTEKKDKTDEALNTIYKKYDSQSKIIIQSFRLLSFSELFKNPFNRTISRDEKITRIFYLSGFCVCPFFGWIFAIIYGSFCKERNTNKKIISIKITSAIQIVLAAIVFVIIALILTRTDKSITYCKNNSVIVKSKPVPKASYSVVFFGPITTNDWMQSRLAKIVENFQFNIFAISFPNIINTMIKSKRHTFLKNALKCAKIKPENVILFSYQLESAINFTIPYLEYNNKILGFFSFNKKFKKKNSKRAKLTPNDVEYLTPQTPVFYDIYSSIALNICRRKTEKTYYGAHYIVHHSFNKYHIRCSNDLTRDYNMVVNNFNYNTTGDEEKQGKHEESDFKEVIDDFYQFLVFIKDIISQNNIEFYKQMLCQNVMCEDKGVVCAF